MPGRPTITPRIDNSSLLRNSSRLLERNKFETHDFCLCPEFDFLTPLMTQLIGGETALIKLLMGGDQVEDDACQFVGHRRNGFGRPEFGPHATIEIAERTLLR